MSEEFNVDPSPINEVWVEGLKNIELSHPDFFVKRRIIDYIGMSYNPMRVSILDTEPSIPIVIKGEIQELYLRAFHRQ